MILDLVGIGIGALDKIPTGKGKRKMAARYLHASADNLGLLMGDLESAANSGEVIGGFSLKMVNARLATTLAVMRTTVNAIGPDDITDDE
jgi:hypothetical protein